MQVKNPYIQSFLTYGLYSVFIACLFLLVKGYAFNSGDQAEHLPLVYKALDPSLYHGDYFVEMATRQFTIRDIYVYLLVYGTAVMPLDAWCFVLTLLCISAASYSIMRITAYFSLDRLAPYLSPVFVLFIFFNFTVGGNHIEDPTLICTTLAKAFALGGLAAFFEKKWVWMSLLLGFASVFQVLVGLQLFLVLMCVNLIFEKHERWKLAGKTALYFILSAAPMLVPILYRQFWMHVSYDHDLYYELLYRFRNYLHYLPSLFPTREYVKLGILLLAALVCMYLFRLKVEKPRVSLMIGIILLGLVLYSLAIAVPGFRFIGKLQWFKTTIWLAAISAILLSIVISKTIQLWISMYTVLAYLRNVVVVGALLALLVLTNSGDIPVSGKVLEDRYQIGNYPHGDLAKMHEWIREHTPKDALFLYSPDNTSFACEAQRPSVIGFKAIIHEPSFLLPWYEKFKLIYGVDTEQALRSNALEEAVISYRALYYPPDPISYDYRIDRVDQCQYLDSLGERIVLVGPYLLTKARHPDPSLHL
ncbi:MAG: hypothetical protein H6585_01175 [Flavobacteriales bacterium]|nr:hypothetical protein [Flavobacteriales bacterium]MCB9446939.1 hypothetical protein [Flavobacteriales bacterium]